MEDFKQLIKHNYLSYASYVILDRAIPNIVDGLKPVQRRLLYTLKKLDDGKLHKVANVVGQTMALHPHGDAPIYEALITVANKEYLLNKQGNFGNPLTGDPAAAARYIETQLSEMARETLFNHDLTTYEPSYDSRNKEPVTLPAKIPLILMQGIDGIAVGMSTRILPHNFIELLKAEIAILEGKEFEVYPDFLSGGIADPSEYDNGRGKLKLRVSIEIKDDKTLIINEICYGTTTESLMRSIEDAARKGKIKIESINDYTAENINIEIKLPRGQHANELINALYAFTDCEVDLHSKLIVIKDNMPCETSVDAILKFHAEQLKGYLKKELEIQQDRLLEKIFIKTLEQIFIEEKIYRKIETIPSLEKIHDTIKTSLKPFHKELARIPTSEDRGHLLQIPIRRISRFDINKHKKEMDTCLQELEQIKKHLKRIKAFTIKYLKELIKKYGKFFPRKTQLQKIQEIDKRNIQTQKLKVGFNIDTGFVGTKVTSENRIECTNFDKLVVMLQNGTYKVINIPEKQYFAEEKNPLVYVGIADKKTIMRIIYHNKRTKIAFAKRFIIDKFILGKEYRYFEEDCILDFLSNKDNQVVKVKFIPQKRQKISRINFEIDDVLIKGRSAKGIRISNKPIKKITPIGGVDKLNI